MLLARSRCSLLCRALCSRLCIFEESGIPGDHLYVKMFSADIRCHDMDCANAFSWVHLLFESLLPNFLVFFEGIEDNTEKAAATFGPPRRAAELARVAAPGMLGAGATPGDLLVWRREFSPPDLVGKGEEASMSVKMKSKLSYPHVHDKSNSVW